MTVPRFGLNRFIPGVLDSTTNFIEHPELVAQRIVRYAEVAGRGRAAGVRAALALTGVE